ncbi:MAG: hypothetical protein IJT70_01480 [Clostridia bacterium]|nr:hypothetical protein [Clostridia bacterium]
MEELINALRERRGALSCRAAELRAQNKDDEAVFCTVRANVYDICATVCDVWSKKGNASKCGEIFARFREDWSASLEDAKLRGDVKKVCVEETKLEALGDVVSRFEAAGC